MRPYGSPKSLEKRRRRAVALLAHGLSLSEVARRVQASVGSVSQWRQAWASGGEEALAAKPVPGRPRKLTDQQCQRLLPLLGLLPLVCEILLQAVSSRSDRFC